jgi:hypothetical protein
MTALFGVGAASDSIPTTGILLLLLCSTVVSITALS